MRLSECDNVNNDNSMNHRDEQSVKRNNTDNDGIDDILKMTIVMMKANMVTTLIRIIFALRVAIIMKMLLIMMIMIVMNLVLI